MQKFHHDKTWNFPHIETNYVMKQKHYFPQKIKCLATAVKPSSA